MEGTEDNRVNFPCGHFVCAPCDARMLANGFLACPTCRQPREGVSQRQVEVANRARVERHAEQEGPRALMLRAGGRNLQVLFFPDESYGSSPFAALGAPRTPRDPTTDDQLLSQAVEAASAVRSILPHLSESSGPMLRLEGPLRELVNQLLTPGTVAEFLAQREVVRGHMRTRRIPRMARD